MNIPTRRAPTRSETAKEERGKPVRIVRVDSTDGADLYGWSRPDSDSGGFAEQIHSAYRNLGDGLRGSGAGPGHVITEKVFLSDFATQRDPLELARRSFYQSGEGETRPTLPASTTVLQPPAVPGRRCEIQAQAFVPRDPSALPGRSMAGLPECASGRIFRRGGTLFVHLANLTGGTPGDGLDFAGESAALFRRAGELLAGEGLSFRDVVRTWIYLPSMERDYDALNLVRRGFFDACGLESYPASTGIQGRVPPPGRECGLDLLALGGGGEFKVRTIHSPTMNEAADYGAYFSRGMRVDFADRAVIFLSGTASIDSTGRVVHVGDPAGQAGEMLNNVEHLLAGQGAGLGDVVSAVTYLKRRVDRPVFESAFARLGFPEGVPHTLCVADVCRPTWLCEMEVIAVLSRP